MSLKVAVQMDPIEGINIEADTTFLMMETAQARGHSLFVYLTESLSLEDGRVFARGRDVTVQRVKGDHARLGELRKVELSDFDVVLMRQDPPFDMHYIDATFFLEAIHPKTLVVNNPAEVRSAPEKIFVTKFPDLAAADPDHLGPRGDPRVPRQARRRGPEAAERPRRFGGDPPSRRRSQPRRSAGDSRRAGP